MVTHFVQRLAYQCGRDDFTTWFGVLAVEFQRRIYLSKIFTSGGALNVKSESSNGVVLIFVNMYSV